MSFGETSLINIMILSQDIMQQLISSTVQLPL